jgi:fructokinase
MIVMPYPVQVLGQVGFGARSGRRVCKTLRTPYHGVIRSHSLTQTAPARMTQHLSPSIGVDLGGTKIEVAVLDAERGFLLRERTPTPHHGYEAILATIAEWVGMAKQRCRLPVGHPVGVGIPGCIDPFTQRVRGANTQVLNGQRLAHDLALRLACPVRIENDANCLALSEAVDGAASGSQVAFAVILGTGCGAGITLGTQVWKGRHALAGEWGHNPLPWPTVEEMQIPACWCGQRGCIEGWLSGPGLAADHLRLTRQNRTPEEIVQAMLKGEAAALDVWRRYIDRLARSLAHVVNMLDPDVIVLGGGMSKVTRLYADLDGAIGTYAFHRPIHTPIKAALHGDSSGVRGAAWLSQMTDAMTAMDSAGATIDNHGASA